ncbi:MAG: aldolase/citrate lyase family protein [Pseudomonadota bacterium]
MFQFSRGRRSVGTFVKTASPHVVEVLGLAGLDFVVLDGEHAPFGRDSADLMLLAGRAARIPVLVRVPDHAPASISSMLDMGAAGVVVPHVDSAAQAAAAVASARFTGGMRGFSPSPRFGDYGTMSREKVIAAGDASLVVCQIESVAGLEQVEAIARVPGVSALFIGRADLSMSLRVDSGRHPVVMAAVARICAACAAAGVPVVIALESEVEIAQFAALGMHGFVVGTDQSLLRRAAAALRPELERQPAIHST